MSVLAFFSPFESQPVSADLLQPDLSTRELAELLVLPLSKRTTPYSYISSLEPPATSGPLLALHTWLVHPSEIQVVRQTANQATIPDLSAQSMTAKRIISILGHLEELKTKLDNKTVHVWREAKRILYAEIFSVTQGLEQNARRRLYDTLTTQNKVTICWDLVPKTANAVAFVFIFPPFTDTGATVVAKRIRASGDFFDVFSSNQQGRKDLDPSVSRISDPYVAEHTVLDVDPTWASLTSITGYAQLATRAVKNNLAAGKTYDYIYSRAMWVQGIYAGALTKIEVPDLDWTVEFSDPLSMDVIGNDRRGPAPNGELFTKLLDPVLDKYKIDPEHAATVFSAAELIAYAYANKILFTNELQKTVMLERIPSLELRQSVEKKASVTNHPTLPSSYYQSVAHPYPIDKSALNLAYFGEFYSNRGLQDITAAMKDLPKHFQAKVHLHVFTDFAPKTKGNSTSKNIPKRQRATLADRATQGIGAEGLEKQIHINQSLPYLEFLSITHYFDYLIVTDARTTKHHSVNPYLPSKWSDYKGSNSQTWALVEEGSSLSEQLSARLTPIDNANSIYDALVSMIQKKLDTSSAASRPSKEIVTREREVTDYSDLLRQEFQPQELEKYDSLGFIYPRLARFIRTYSQLPRFVRRFLPPKSMGSIYPAPKTRTVVLSTSGRFRRKTAYEMTHVGQITVEEPFITSQASSFRDSLKYPYHLEAPSAVSYLAMMISSEARNIGASQISGELQPISGLAGLLAARRLGIPFELIVDNEQDGLRVLNSSIKERAAHPLLELLYVLLSNADGMQVRDGTSVELISQLKLEDEEAPKASLPTRSPTAKPFLGYIGFGLYQGIFELLSDLHEIEDVDQLLDIVPDILIIDLHRHSATQPEMPDALQDIPRAANILNNLRKSGSVLVLLIPQIDTSNSLLTKIINIVDLVSLDNMTELVRYFKFRRTTPKILFSAASATQIRPTDTTTFGNSWDKFGASVLAAQPGRPPVTFNKGWDSSLSSDRRIHLTRYLNGDEISVQKASWDALCEFSQGHSAVDFGVHLLRAAGFKTKHPRAPHAERGSNSLDIFYRATGQSPDAIATTKTTDSIEYKDSKFIHSAISTSAKYSLPSADQRGVSLIIATYQGATRITQLLDSIAAQSLPLALIEIVVIPNGPHDGTSEVVNHWAQRHPQLHIKMQIQEEANVARARNAGLNLATRDYITFVDDDDYLQHNYLASMLLRADRDIVVLGRLNDVMKKANEVAKVNIDTAMNKRVRSAGATLFPLVRSWNALSMNAAKLIPSGAAKSIRYDPTLKSGEDQVYLVQLLQFDLKVTGARDMGMDAYMRVHREDSVSRRPMSMQFSVIERLEVMSRFRDIASKHDNSALKYATKNLSRWHAIALMRYADAQADSPKQLIQISEAIHDAGFSNQPEFRGLI